MWRHIFVILIHSFILYITNRVFDNIGFELKEYGFNKETYEQFSEENEKI
jgi:hypothetical protein